MFNVYIGLVHNYCILLDFWKIFKYRKIGYNLFNTKCLISSHLICLGPTFYFFLICFLMEMGYKKQQFLSIYLLWI